LEGIALTEKMQLSIANQVHVYTVLTKTLQLKYHILHNAIALQCEEGDLRLTGGNTINKGRVEICKNETWGPICSTNHQWGQSEATVTCRQLGFSQHGIRDQILYVPTKKSTAHI
jgi:hypothetical protein